MSCGCSTATVQYSNMFLETASLCETFHGRFDKYPHNMRRLRGNLSKCHGSSKTLLQDKSTNVRLSTWSNHHSCAQITWLRVACPVLQILRNYDVDQGLTTSFFCTLSHASPCMRDVFGSTNTNCTSVIYAYTPTLPWWETRSMFTRKVQDHDSCFSSEN